MSPIDAIFKEFPAELFLSDEGARAGYGRDWLSEFTPAPGCIALPRSTEEVAHLVGWCAQHRVPVVPSGGRTGLSGGAAATNGELVLSLERLNRIHEVRVIDRLLRCGAGTVTARIQETAKDHGLFFPVDFASKGSSQIGGNIATNAGGIHVIRYGNIREWVIGLTVVDGRGEVHHLNGPLFKNNTGYDLRSLMIGSEGTLGIITEATLLLTDPPGTLCRALCALPSLEGVLELLTNLRGRFGTLSAFEYLSDRAKMLVTRHEGIRSPLAVEAPAWIVAEFEHTTPTLEEEIENFLSEMAERGLILDAVVSRSTQQCEEIMALRERISPMLSANYTLHKNDISVPVPTIPRFIRALEELMALQYPEFEVVIFGHIGDGNLHVNVLKPAATEAAHFFEAASRADREVFALVSACAGSISAEHGVGLLKKDFLHYSRSTAEIALMRGIKQVFDPAGILNPGKIFDPVEK